jgi:16S rRNA U516 pseudouridylate synthase RsuA-like enzyme
MFDAIGHSVIKLVRTRIGKLEEKGLRPGAWRRLTEREVKQLKGPNPPAKNVPPRKNVRHVR